MIRVAIADDHTILREGLRQLLASAADVAVVAEAADGDAALALARAGGFDVLVLDLSMPGRSGIELIRQIKAECPRLHILILTMHEESQYAVRAIKAGAAGYVTKDRAATELVDALHAVAGGGAHVSANVAQALALAAMPGAHRPAHERLSDREFQVFDLLVRGVSVTDIALRLNLSSKTVSTHKARLMEKLDVDNPAELVRYALRHGLGEAAG
ncbi:MAG: response regulator transcription factor [Burkholderiales bacterium]|nr:response regulator transcription factor [Burkholderiales bacterium]